MATDQKIEDFIGESFSSIWDLEILATLIENEGVPMTAETLVERLRASALIVGQGSRVLAAAGLASCGEGGEIEFRPATRDLEEFARGACRFYRNFPGRARRAIIARNAPGLSAFADAFRIKKD